MKGEEKVDVDRLIQLLNYVNNYIFSWITKNLVVFLGRSFETRGALSIEKKFHNKEENLNQEDMKMNNLKPLSKKEEEIMGCFWQRGSLFVREVVEMMPDPKPHFNTVSTFVRMLETKGWLAHERLGNAYRYYAIVNVEDYRDSSLKGIVDRLFGKSYLSFVSSLVKEEKISTDELRELIETIERGKERNDG